MSSFGTKFLLGTYRKIGTLMYPFMGPFLALRAKRGKEDRHRRYERYGYASDDRPQGPLIWFHAASVGESHGNSCFDCEHVKSLGVNTIMTTGTVTSAEVVKSRLPKSACINLCHLI